MRVIPLSAAYALLLASSSVLAPGLSAQCGAGEPFNTGVVQVTSGPSYGWSDTFPGSYRMVLSVQCVGIVPADVQLRVWEPRHQDPIGTVMFIAGGSAPGFYAGNPVALPMQRRLIELGYRVVDTRWIGGWFRQGNEVGIKRQSCRVGTLIEWMDTSIHTEGEFVAVGNSGGAGAICYALTTWSAGNYLDRVVLGGGPPMSRLDFTCQNPLTQPWLGFCQLLIPPNTFTCGMPACSDPTSIVCKLCTDATASELRADSVMHTGAIYDFPNTEMHLLLGGEDCTVGVATALFFYNAVTSAKRVRFIPGAPHFVPGTETGRDAIIESIVGRDLTWRQLPQGPFNLEVSAAPGGVYPVFLRDHDDPQSTIGWVFMRLPELLVGRGELVSELVGGTVRMQFPNDR